MSLFFNPRTHWLKERLSPQEERPWNTVVNEYGNNYPSLLSNRPMIIYLGNHTLGKKKYQDIWRLLDTSSKLTLTLRDQKFHNGLTVRTAIKRGQIIKDFIPGPPHNEFIGSRNLPSGHFSGPPQHINIMVDRTPRYIVFCLGGDGPLG